MPVTVVATTQILIHEVKAIIPGVYRAYLIRDLTRPDRAPVTSWTYSKDGTVVTINTLIGVSEVVTNPSDFATVSITSNFAKRCTPVGAIAATGGQDCRLVLCT